MGVQTLFRILCRWFPLPADYAESGKSLLELSRDYRKWEVFAGWILFPLCLPLALAWWWILGGIGVLVANQFSGAVFQLRMSGIAWLLPAMPLAFLTADWPITAFIRWRLGARYPEYIRYCNLKHQYDNQGAATPIVLASSGFLVLVVLLMLHWRAIFSKEDMAIYPFFSPITIRHSYKDIVEIRTAPKCKAPSGKIVDNGDNDHVIQFSDGARWSTFWL